MRTFVPCAEAGQQVSIDFYEAIGFKKLWGEADGGVCEIDTTSGHRFLLLPNYNDSLAQNLMMQFWVESVDLWFAHLESLDLPGRFPGSKVSEPDEMPWGWRICHVWDPAGVLLHFAEPCTEENRAFFDDAAWLER